MKKNVVIIMLAILVLGLGGYLVYEKTLSGNDKEINNNIVKKQYDLIAAKFIIDSFLNSNMINKIDRIVDTALDEETKLAMAIASIESMGSYSCEDLFSENYYENDGWFCSSSPQQYSYERVNKQYKKFFGDSKEAPKQDVLYRYSVYEYAEKQGVYVELSPKFGPISPNIYYYEVESAEKENNQLKIEIAYLTKAVPAWGDETIENNMKQEYKNRKNSLPVLTFVFEEENNNYVLKAIE